MKTKASIVVPSVDEILKETAENFEAISENINRINNTNPPELEENESNTNMLLLIKRYINNLPNTGLILSSDDLGTISKLISITDNITNATFTRICDMLNVSFTITIMNPNHKLYIQSDGKTLSDNGREMTIDTTTGTMLANILQHVINYYGEVDLKRNTEYIPVYSINNILTAIKNDRKISSYLFEKFCKLWGISYRYIITSNVDTKVQLDLTIDPSQWF
jgi:hypothetical protein